MERRPLTLTNLLNAKLVRVSASTRRHTETGSKAQCGTCNYEGFQPRCLISTHVWMTIVDVSWCYPGDVTRAGGLVCRLSPRAELCTDANACQLTSRGRRGETPAATSWSSHWSKTAKSLCVRNTAIFVAQRALSVRRRVYRVHTHFGDYYSGMSASRRLPNAPKTRLLLASHG